MPRAEVAHGLEFRHRLACSFGAGVDERRFSQDRFPVYALSRMAARYYIHVTETHVAAGFGKFVEYQARNVKEGIAAAFPQASGAVR